MPEEIDLKRGRRQQAENAEPGQDRLPPNSPEAEQGLLSSILLDPPMVMPMCVERMGGEGEQFYDMRHQTIFKTMVELYEDGDPIEVISLVTRLKLWNTLEQVGGTEYLSTLPDVAPSAANYSYYLDIVLEKFLLRKTIRVCGNTISRIYEYEGEVDTLMDEVERDILRISEERVTPVSMSVKELVRRSIERMEDAALNKRTVQGLATGFPDFDRMTGGLKGGEMIVIAARPSVGKTSLAMNIAEYVSVTNKIPTAVFSLEMTADSLMDRLISSRARVNLRNMRDGFLADRDFPKITAAAGTITAAPLYIEDQAGISILQLRAKARRLFQQYGIKLVVIDYLQLLNALGGKRRFESRQQEVSDISSGVKALAKELNVPVIVLSQLNRQIEQEKNRRPRLADLRESGSIEQDADVVGMLYKPMIKDQDDDGNSDEAIQVNLDIAKQRNGPTGTVTLTFLKSYTRFESSARLSPDDMPPDVQPEMNYRAQTVDA